MRQFGAWMTSHKTIHKNQMKIDKQKFATELLENITGYGVYSVAIEEDSSDCLTAFIKEDDTGHVAVVQATPRGVSTIYLSKHLEILKLKEIIK